MTSTTQSVGLMEAADEERTNNREASESTDMETLMNTTRKLLIPIKAERHAQPAGTSKSDQSNSSATMCSEMN